MNGIEQFRPGFEEWARKEGYDEKEIALRWSDDYSIISIRKAWHAWLGAKRESVSGSSTSTSQGAAEIDHLWDMVAGARYALRDIASGGDDPAVVADAALAVLTKLEDEFASQCRAEGGNISGLLGASKSTETRMDSGSEGGHLSGNSGAAPGDALDAATITVIRSSIADYYRALNARQHGELAMDRSFRAIERELGMSWDMWTRAELSAIAASTTQREGN